MKQFLLSLIAVVTFVCGSLGCGAITTVDAAPDACPPLPPPPPLSCDACTPHPLPGLIEGSAARAVYAWTYHPGPTPPWTFTGFMSPVWEAPGTGGVVDVPDVLIGDDLVVLGHLLVEAVDGDAGLRLVVEENGHEPVPAPGAAATVTATSPNWIAVDLVGHWSATSDGPARVRLEGRADPGGRMYVQASAEIVVVHLRP